MQTLPIHVVSLASALERRKNVTEQMSNQNLEFQFFDAIEGHTIDDSAISEVYDSETNSKRFKRPLSKPEIGCYLSHLQLWQGIAQSDKSAAIILEDDLRVLEPLSTLIESLGALALEDVVIKLDAPLSAAGNGDGQMLEEPFRVYQPRAIAPLTLGYVIGRRAAGRMSVIRERFFRPVDNDIKHFWEHQVPVHHIAPRVIGENKQLSMASHIDRARRTSKGNPLSRFLRHLRYQSHVMSGRLKRQPDHLIASRETTQ
jgi:glycosyl transferase family 25